MVQDISVVVVDRDVDRWANPTVDKTLLVVGGDHGVPIVGLHRVEGLASEISSLHTSLSPAPANALSGIIVTQQVQDELQQNGSSI